MRTALLGLILAGGVAGPFGAQPRVEESSPVFPWRVAESRRYLVDARERPVLLQAEAAWSLIIGLTLEEVDHYLRDRRARGFNGIIVNLIEHAFPGAANPHAAPRNRQGAGPFATPGDFSTPNEAYFAHADAVLARAEVAGFAVFLAPCYLGYPRLTEGWYEEVLQNGVDRCRAYGRFVGRRYRDRLNLIWVMSGDRNPDAARPMVEAMAAGLREGGAAQLMTAHCQPGESPRQIFPASPWLQLDNVYTYDPVHRNSLYAYLTKPLMPFLLFESAYENERGASAGRLRAQAYTALLAGACGQAFGNLPIWKFGSGWEAALGSEGSRSMAHVTALFRSRRWTELEPDATHEIVTEGYIGGDTWVGCARTRDRRTVILYLPERPPRQKSEPANPRRHAPTVDVDLGQLNGRAVTAWWYNPRDGTATAGGEFPAKGTRTFTRPDDADWVLVLDDSAAQWPAPGTGGDRTR
ncbi:MAG: DUF4038 domain-containing protein [Verrucomicrobia bacterium]|nr:DUF4038 domain-containing protein [Verrucomicrobiota bacterium]